MNFALRKSQFKCFLNLNGSEDFGGCPKVWDGLMCWNKQDPSVVSTAPCASYVHDFTTEEFARKSCTDKGQWYRHTISNWTWTNYSSCKVDLDKMRMISKSQFYLTLSGYGLSVTSLVVALGIFFTFRSLQCQRITIHKNLFFSYIFSAVVAVMWLFSLSGTPTDNKIYCKVLAALHQYTTLCNYFWMLCEGIFLYSFAVVAVFRDKQNMWLFLLLGWGAPVIPALLYTMSRLVFDSSGCWVFSRSSIVLYIIQGPAMVALLLNFVILIHLLKVLLKKLRSGPGRGNDYKRYVLAVRATLILVPLLGGQHIFLSFSAFISNPTAKLVGNYLQIVLNSLQGFVVALIFCFCHEEVVAKVQNLLTFRCVRSSKSNNNTGNRIDHNRRSTPGTQMEAFSQMGETDQMFATTCS